MKKNIKKSNKKTNNSKTIKDINTKFCMCHLLPKSYLNRNFGQIWTKNKKVGVANLIIFGVYWATENSF